MPGLLSSGGIVSVVASGRIELETPPEPPPGFSFLLFSGTSQGEAANVLQFFADPGVQTGVRTTRTGFQNFTILGRSFKNFLIKPVVNTFTQDVVVEFKRNDLPTLFSFTIPAGSTVLQSNTTDIVVFTDNQRLDVRIDLPNTIDTDEFLELAMSVEAIL